MPAQPAIHDTPGLMTLAEAAKSLHQGLAVNTLREARKRGELKAIWLGGRYYVTPDALQEFLQCRALANPPASISARMNSNMSSETEAPRSGQDMALASIKKLKQLSQNTSLKKPCPKEAGRPSRGK